MSKANSLDKRAIDPYQQILQRQALDQSPDSEIKESDLKIREMSKSTDEEPTLSSKHQVFSKIKVPDSIKKQYETGSSRGHVSTSQQSLTATNQTVGAYQGKSAVDYAAANSGRKRVKNPHALIGQSQSPQHQSRKIHKNHQGSSLTSFNRLRVPYNNKKVKHGEYFPCKMPRTSTSSEVSGKQSDSKHLKLINQSAKNTSLNDQHNADIKQHLQQQRQTYEKYVLWQNGQSKDRRTQFGRNKTSRDHDSDYTFAKSKSPFVLDSSANNTQSTLSQHGASPANSLELKKMISVKDEEEGILVEERIVKQSEKKIRQEDAYQLEVTAESKPSTSELSSRNQSQSRHRSCSRESKNMDILMQSSPDNSIDYSLTGLNYKPNKQQGSKISTKHLIPFKMNKVEFQVYEQSPDPNPHKTVDKNNQILVLQTQERTQIQLQQERQRNFQAEMGLQDTPEFRHNRLLMKQNKAFKQEGLVKTITQSSITSAKASIISQPKESERQTVKLQDQAQNTDQSMMETITSFEGKNSVISGVFVNSKGMQQSRMRASAHTQQQSHKLSLISSIDEKNNSNNPSVEHSFAYSMGAFKSKKPLRSQQNSKHLTQENYSTLNPIGSRKFSQQSQQSAGPSKQQLQSFMVKKINRLSQQGYNTFNQQVSHVLSLETSNKYKKKNRRNIVNSQTTSAQVFELDTSGNVVQISSQSIKGKILPLGKLPEHEFAVTGISGRRILKKNIVADYDYQGSPNKAVSLMHTRSTSLHANSSNRFDQRDYSASLSKPGSSSGQRIYQGVVAFNNEGGLMSSSPYDDSQVEYQHGPGYKKKADSQRDNERAKSDLTVSPDKIAAFNEARKHLSTSNEGLRRSRESVGLDEGTRKMKTEQMSRINFAKKRDQSAASAVFIRLASAAQPELNVMSSAASNSMMEPPKPTNLTTHKNFQVSFSRDMRRINFQNLGELQKFLKVQADGQRLKSAKIGLQLGRLKGNNIKKSKKIFKQMITGDYSKSPDAPSQEYVVNLMNETQDSRPSQKTMISKKKLKQRSAYTPDITQKTKKQVYCNHWRHLKPANWEDTKGTTLDSKHLLDNETSLQLESRDDSASKAGVNPVEGQSTLKASNASKYDISVSNASKKQDYCLDNVKASKKRQSSMGETPIVDDLSTLHYIGSQQAEITHASMPRKETSSDNAAIIKDANASYSQYDSKSFMNAPSQAYQKSEEKSSESSLEKKEKQIRGMKPILVSAGGKKIIGSADTSWGGITMQEKKDLFKAQNLAVPFSGDYFKPIWKSGQHENKTFKRAMTLTDKDPRKALAAQFGKISLANQQVDEISESTSQEQTDTETTQEMGSFIRQNTHEDKNRFSVIQQKSFKLPQAFIGQPQMNAQANLVNIQTNVDKRASIKQNQYYFMSQDKHIIASNQHNSLKGSNSASFQSQHQTLKHTQNIKKHSLETIKENQKSQQQLITDELNSDHVDSTNIKHGRRMSNKYSKNSQKTTQKSPKPEMVYKQSTSTTEIHSSRGVTHGGAIEHKFIPNQDVSPTTDEQKLSNQYQMFLKRQNSSLANSSNMPVGNSVNMQSTLDQNQKSYELYSTSKLEETTLEGPSQDFKGQLTSFEQQDKSQRKIVHQRTPNKD